MVTVLQAVVDAGIVDEKVWPNLFLVGPGRTGTTTLYNILKKIPGIYFPGIKEPGYFCYGLEAHRLLYSLGGVTRGQQRLFVTSAQVIRRALNS